MGIADLPGANPAETGEPGGLSDTPLAGEPEATVLGAPQIRVLDTSLASAVMAQARSRRPDVASIRTGRETPLSLSESIAGTIRRQRQDRLRRRPAMGGGEDGSGDDPDEMPPAA